MTQALIVSDYLTATGLMDHSRPSLRKHLELAFKGVTRKDMAGSSNNQNYAFGWILKSA
jgi:hypothetical protein